jgi:hypothetical protein
VLFTQAMALAAEGADLAPRCSRREL